jgi:uncharacterized protein
VKLFAVQCRDRTDSAALRAEHLAAHLAHVEANIDRYRVAGPLRDEAGTIVGSLLVISAEDANEAAAFLADDPYSDAGIWEEVRIDAFAAVAGEWVGGATWKRSAPPMQG